jgi:hypothetical protein
VQDARGQRRHGDAAQAQHHGQYGAAVEPDQGEDAVADHRQARQVAGILEHAESEEEGADDGQDQRQRIRHAHGPQPVLADQQRGQPGPGHDALDPLRDRRVEHALEQVLFQQADQHRGAKHADELIHGIQRGEQDGQAPHRMHYPLADALRQQRRGTRAALQAACSEHAGGLAAFARQGFRQLATVALLGVGTNRCQRGVKVAGLPLQPTHGFGIVPEMEHGQAARVESRMAGSGFDACCQRGQRDLGIRVVMQQLVWRARGGNGAAEFGHAFAAGRHRGHHRDAQRGFERRHVEHHAACLGFVVHV